MRGLEIPCHRCGKAVDITDLPHGGPAYCEQCVKKYEDNEAKWRDKCEAFQFHFGGSQNRR